MSKKEGKERIEKRKNTPLTRNEWLGFFFFPFRNSKTFFNSKEFNMEEEDRFIKYNFDKKLEQSKDVRKLGIAFYVIVILLYNILF